MSKKVKSEVMEGQEGSASITVTSSKKLGRPVNPNSKRQAELAGKTNKGIMLSDGTIYVPKGRPVDPTSKRQIELAEKGTKGAGQKGRPKMTEDEKAAAKAERERQKELARQEGLI